MKYKVIDLPQGSKEWLEFRQNKIGGSDIPSILRIPGAYKTRQKLLEEKVTGIAKVPTDFEQALFDRGHELESIVRIKIQNHLGFDLPPVVIQSVHNQGFIASLDGFNQTENVILEIKSTKNADRLKDAENEVVSQVYYAQVQWQLFVSGAKYAYLAVINSETEELFMMQIAHDLQMQEQMVHEVSKFVLEKNRAVKPVTDLQSTTLHYIEQAKRTISEYQKLIDAEEEKIKEMAEKLLAEYGATKIEDDNLKIEWAERKGNVDYSKIKELEGVDLEKHRKPASKFVKITVKK